MVRRRLAPRESRARVGRARTTADRCCREGQYAAVDATQNLSLRRKKFIHVRSESHSRSERTARRPFCSRQLHQPEMAVAQDCRCCSILSLSVLPAHRFVALEGARCAPSSHSDYGLGSSRRMAHALLKSSVFQTYRRTPPVSDSAPCGVHATAAAEVGRFIAMGCPARHDYNTRPGGLCHV